MRAKADMRAPDAGRGRRRTGRAGNGATPFRSGRRDAGRAGLAIVALAGGLAASVQPALAELCDMRVYDATLNAGNQLVQQGEADQLFAVDDFFVVCFYARRDGFVTLWDRMPQDAPVERVVPGPHYTGEGVIAAKVTGGERSCFGTGRDGYYMTMEAKDGVGVGLMWLVFTAKEEDHPTSDTYDSVGQFANSWENSMLGAGSLAAAGADAPDPNTVPDADLSACRWESSLEYQYRVRPR